MEKNVQGREQEIHEEADLIRHAAPEAGEIRQEELESLSDLFSSFGDMTRLRILHVLMRGKICVNDLAGCLNMTQSAVSHQLKILKNSRLIKSTRAGKRIFYSLDDDHVYSILLGGIMHIRE